MNFAIEQRQQRWFDDIAIIDDEHFAETHGQFQVVCKSIGTLSGQLERHVDGFQIVGQPRDGAFAGVV